MGVSAILYGRRYSSTQMLGVVGVVGGVVLSLLPSLTVAGGRTVLLSSFGFVGSFVLLAMAISIKEVVLKGGSVGSRGALSAPPGEDGKRPDLFVVNAFGSLAQLMATMAFLPAILSIAGQQSGAAGLALYMREGMHGLFNSAFMPWLTLGYVFANIMMNLFGLTLMSRASSTVVLMSSVAALPIVSLIFCFPLPLVTPSPFSWFTVAGLVVVMLGIALYNKPTAPLAEQSGSTS